MQNKQAKERYLMAMHHIQNKIHTCTSDARCTSVAGWLRWLHSNIRRYTNPAHSYDHSKRWSLSRSSYSTSKLWEFSILFWHKHRWNGKYVLDSIFLQIFHYEAVTALLKVIPSLNICVEQPWTSLLGHSHVWHLIIVLYSKCKFMRTSHRYTKNAFDRLYLLPDTTLTTYT
jgi:hypothetical protein